jgi:hypothetical protein
MISTESGFDDGAHELHGRLLAGEELELLGGLRDEHLESRDGHTATLAR